MEYTFQIYLAGGMQNLSFEKQLEWRDRFVAKTQEIVELSIDYGCDCFVPSVRFINPVRYYNYEHKKYDTEKEVMNFDTRLVKNSDLLIVNANDPNSIGTSMEIAIAHEHNIPILIFNEKDEDLHPWWIEMSDKIFKDEYDMYNYIVKFYLVHRDYINKY